MKIFKKSDIILIFAVLFVARMIFAINSLEKGPPVAHIIVGGEEYKTVNLVDIPEKQVFILETHPETIIVCEKGCAYFSSAGCPDKICVKTGRLTKKGDTAVCLPAGVVLTIEGGEYDAVTY